MSVTAPPVRSLDSRGDRDALPVRNARAPLWVSRSMVALLLVSAVVYGADAAGSGYSDYYATAAKSMSISWKAFFFGAFDPHATISLDKLSGFLIPQALSARLLGFSAWSLALPQVLEGLVTIVAVYFIVRRWIGPIGGLIGASLFASTPLVVSMFSHPMEDGMLTMFSVLALAAFQRAIDTDTRRYLMLAGALVGLAFQAKMLQAWLVLPSMALTYLLVTDQPVAVKIRRLVAAGIVTVAVSFSWMTAIALVPGRSRPFIDGTINNNIFSMVLGYNGTDRFLSNFFPGALSNDPIPRAAADARLVSILPSDLAHSPAKLFVADYASQIGWLYPLAVLGLVLGIFVIRKSRWSHDTRRPIRVAIVLNGSLLVVLGTVMSVMTLPHTAYLASMSFSLAALAALGIVLAWREPLVRRSRLRFALPAAVLVQTVWSIALMANYPLFVGWLPVAVGLAGCASAAALFLRALERDSVSRLVGIVAIASALVAPIAWSLSTLDTAFAGTANDAYAGPPAAATIRMRAEPTGPYGIGQDSNRLEPTTLHLEAQIYSYARVHSGTRSFALATDTWRAAAPLILHGHRGVMPIGGYTTRVPSPDPARLRAMVAAGTLRFVLLTGPDSKSGISTPNVFAIDRWVAASCALVPPRAYRAAAASAPIPDRLFDCAAP
jgi:4-amino-4-deoxy-L-arabinose transferase-like glycosyltransferase